MDPIIILKFTVMYF